MEPEIQLLQPENIGEMNELIALFENVFEMSPYKRPPQNHLLKLMQQDNFFAVVARHENRITGGLTVYILGQYYSEKPLAYIFDLAVLQEFQRKGIGRKLVEFTLNYCRQKGFEEVFVQADKTDDYAIEFYRSLNPSTEEPVVHFSYRL